MEPKQLKFVNDVILGICFCLLLSLGNSVIYGATEKAATYIVYKDGTTYYALNGHTDVIDYSGTGAATVIQSAIDNVGTMGGGMLYFKEATFEIGTTLTHPSNIILKGSGKNTVFKWTGSSGGSVIKNKNYGMQERDKYIVAENFYLDGNGSASYGVEYLSIEDSLVSNIDGVNFTNKAVSCGGFERTLVLNCPSYGYSLAFATSTTGWILDGGNAQSAGIIDVYNKGATGIYAENTNYATSDWASAIRIEQWSTRPYVAGLSVAEQTGKRGILVTNETGAGIGIQISTNTNVPTYWTGLLVENPKTTALDNSLLDLRSDQPDSYFIRSRGAGNADVFGVKRGGILKIGGGFENDKGLQRGQATLNAGTGSLSVTLPVAEPDNVYYVQLTGDGNQTLWVTNKTTTAFTINRSATTGTRKVDWLLMR